MIESDVGFWPEVWVELIHSTGDFTRDGHLVELWSVCAAIGSIKHACTFATESEARQAYEVAAASGRRWVS